MKTKFYLYQQFCSELQTEAVAAWLAIRACKMYLSKPILKTSLKLAQRCKGRSSDLPHI